MAVHPNSNRPKEIWKRNGSPTYAAGPETLKFYIEIGWKTEESGVNSRAGYVNYRDLEGFNKLKEAPGVRFGNGDQYLREFNKLEFNKLNGVPKRGNLPAVWGVFGWYYPYSSYSGEMYTPRYYSEVELANWNRWRFFSRTANCNL